MAYSLKNVAETTMPIGSIVAFYGTSPPSGWLICDGRSCAGTPLATLIGKTTVPDLRGRFIRMIGGNAAGMAVAQSDCIRNITGSFVPWAYNSAEVSGAIYKSGTTYDAYQVAGAYWGAKMFFDASRVVPTGPENRPINMAFNYIIKANYSLRIISIVDFEEVA